MPRGSTRPFGTTDAETDPFKAGRVPQPFAWGLYFGAAHGSPAGGNAQESYEEFENASQLADRVRDMRATVYAHNGGKFDYHYLRDEINSDQPIMVINGRLARFKIGECEFRDSLNIFPNTRLEDFGSKRKIDYNLMEADRRTDPNVAAEISLYLRQDCVSLWDQVARYRAEFGKQLTQASASMKYWEKMYELQAPRQTRTQHQRYRPYYYGGRVQCFTSGVCARPFRVADINSAYPFAMLREHMFSPEGVKEKHLPPEPEIYRCLIKLDCTSRGALPWREPETGELYFPDDEGGARCRMRSYTVTGWEFIAGMELGAISNVHIREVHTFTKAINFREYIEHFYEMREEARKRGDVAGRIFGKYFMNSLYGKFGANPENYCEYVIASSDTVTKWKEKGYRHYKEWGGRYLMAREPTEDQLNDPTGRWRYYNVATAASVTGYVRAMLFRALNQCGDALYCDTDSIAARDTARLDFGDALGQWKDEGDFDRYAIAGKKLYAFHHTGRSLDYDSKVEEKDRTWKIASKGVNFARFDDGPERIARIARGESVDFEPEVPTYSVTREEPKFITRTVARTYKDMSKAPTDKRYERRRNALAFGILTD